MSSDLTGSLAALSLVLAKQTLEVLSDKKVKGKKVSKKKINKIIKKGGSNTSSNVASNSNTSSNVSGNNSLSGGSTANRRRRNNRNRVV